MEETPQDGGFPTWGRGVASDTPFTADPSAATADDGTLDPYRTFVSLGDLAPAATVTPNALFMGPQIVNSLGNLYNMWNAPGGFSLEQQTAISALASMYSGQNSLASPNAALGFLRDASILAYQNNISVSEQMLRLAGVGSFSEAQKIASTMNSNALGGPSTITSVDYLSEDSAKRLVNQALKAYLGRAATDEESANFAKALRTAQGENPQVVTTSGSSRVAEGGLDVSAFAEDYAKSQPDYAEYQGATKYLDLFLGALS